MESKYIITCESLKFTDKNDKNKGFTWIHKNKEITSFGTEADNWICRPFETSREYIEGVKKVKLIAEIVGMLPKIELPIYEIYSDYPIIKKEALNMIGVTIYCDRRPIFAIGASKESNSVIFFRRNNDDYGSEIHYSTKSHDNKYISWEGLVGPNFIKNLYTLLKNKDVFQITRHEIDLILNI